jgi:co-chaperonin GroES (HSP10)
MLRQGVNAEDLGERVHLKEAGGGWLHADVRNISEREIMLGRAEGVPAILRGWAIVPLEDKLLVRYASFKEGYVCTTCDGSGKSIMLCTACRGKRLVAPREGWTDRPCSECVVVGAEGREPRPCGYSPCPECRGSGLAPGILAIPDESKQDHSYGDIVAVGPHVYDLEPGDRVLFSRLAGIHIHGDIVCCLMRRGEVMGLMRKP